MPREDTALKRGCVQSRNIDMLLAFDGWRDTAGKFPGLPDAVDHLQNGNSSTDSLT